MLAQQIDRILLIEKFMNVVWNIGKVGWGSGTGKSCKIMGDILEAIINKVDLSIGLGFDDHIPPREAAKFPFGLVEELRQAGITADDLNKINQRRAANKNTVVYLAETLLAKGFRDFENMELHIWEVIHGKGSSYLSASDIQTAKEANFIKIDLSGFFTRSRVMFFKTFFTETNLNSQQIFDLSLPLSEEAQNVASDRLINQKDLVEIDFLRLKDHGITAADAITDIINIGKGLESKYNHIRPSYFVSTARIDFKYVEYIAASMIRVLSRKYKYDPNALKPAPFEPPKPIPPKTAEELAAEKIARENAYQSLIKHFNLAPEDARRVAKTTQIDYLQSLWHIKTNVMPGVEKVLEEMMEQFSGNIQMVEDLVVFEQVIWTNETRAWEKYRIPAQHTSSHAKTMTSYVSKAHSDTLVNLNLNFTLPLIKPLRQNLTMKYQANHPGEVIVVGRDLELFKKLTFIHDWKSVPEFMFDNSNVIAVINPAKSSEAPTSAPPMFSDYQDAAHASELRDLTVNHRSGITGSGLVLAGDIIILGTLAMIMLYSFRKPLNYWRKTLFGSRQDAQYAPVSTKDDESRVDIKINKFG